MTFISDGANNVQPDNSRSPSESTRETQSAIASARIFDIRMRSLGSLDCNFRRNSEKTVIVRLPSMKSITAWPNQSANVEVYILQDDVSRGIDIVQSKGIPRQRVHTIIQQTTQVPLSCPGTLSISVYEALLQDHLVKSPCKAVRNQTSEVKNYTYLKSRCARTADNACSAIIISGSRQHLLFSTNGVSIIGPGCQAHQQRIPRVAALHSPSLSTTSVSILCDPVGYCKATEPSCLFNTCLAKADWQIRR